MTTGAGVSGTAAGPPPWAYRGGSPPTGRRPALPRRSGRRLLLLGVGLLCAALGGLVVALHEYQQRIGHHTVDVVELGQGCYRYVTVDGVRSAVLVATTDDSGPANCSRVIQFVERLEPRLP